MQLSITSFEALWFLPFVIPICLWVVLSDLRTMRIPNKTVLLLVGVFVVIGLIALPFYPDYTWRLVQMAVVLVIGIVANMAGLMGAGDAKFIAAAAPFVALGDLRILGFVFAANLLAAFSAHRIAKYTGLRRMVPDWKSWDMGKKFPMGLSLGTTLIIYLVLGAFFGT